MCQVGSRGGVRTGVVVLASLEKILSIMHHVCVGGGEYARCAPKPGLRVGVKTNKGLLNPKSLPRPGRQVDPAVASVILSAAGTVIGSKIVAARCVQGLAALNSTGRGSAGLRAVLLRPSAPSGRSSFI